VKFLVDQQLPRALAGWLRARGCEGVHVKDLGLQHADDAVIWAEAIRLGASIITKDEDFSLIVRAGEGASVVWLRFGNCSNARLFALLDASWLGIVAALAEGEKLVEVC
jgi:predicted nuclease of predicted toxin-antitoxin system